MTEHQRLDLLTPAVQRIVRAELAEHTGTVDAQLLEAHQRIGRLQRDLELQTEWTDAERQAKGEAQQELCDLRSAVGDLRGRLSAIAAHNAELIEARRALRQQVDELRATGGV